MMRLEGVGHSFGKEILFRDIHLALNPGECLLVTGGNGVGKTTLIKIAAGLLKPAQGEVLRQGKVGVLLHEVSLFPHLTAKEFLDFIGVLHGKGTEGAAVLLEKVGLKAHSRIPVHLYSEGMKKRLSLARLLLEDPTLLLLDEPEASLDREGKEMLLAILHSFLERGASLLIASHHAAFYDTCKPRSLRLGEAVAHA